MRTTTLTVALLASLSAAEAHPSGWDTRDPAADHRAGPARLRDLADAPTQPAAAEGVGDQSPEPSARTLLPATATRASGA